MDDYLSDKEQIERIRQWWRENGWFLIGGAALALLGLFGWSQYQSYRTGQSEQASALYDSIKEAANGSTPDQALPLLAQLEAEFPDHIYTQQARLLVARAQLVSTPERAVEELRQTMTTSDDPELAMVARLRLARVLAYREQYQEALALLDVESPGQFAGRINEIKGDIHASMGQVEEARAAYLAAMVSPGAELLDRSFLQMKLGDLPEETVASTSAAPEAVPAAEPAEPALGEPGDGA